MTCFGPGELDCLTCFHPLKLTGTTCLESCLPGTCSSSSSSSSVCLVINSVGVQYTTDDLAPELSLLRNVVVYSSLQTSLAYLSLLSGSHSVNQSVLIQTARPVKEQYTHQNPQSKIHMQTVGLLLNCNYLTSESQMHPSFDINYFSDKIVCRKVALILLLILTVLRAM